MFLSGIICMENVSRTVLGIFPCWWLLPKTIRRPAQLSRDEDFWTKMSMYFPALLGMSKRFLKSPKLCAFWSTKALFLMTQLHFYFLVYLLWEHWSKEQWKITATLEPNQPLAQTKDVPIHNIHTQVETWDSLFLKLPDDALA